MELSKRDIELIADAIAEWKLRKMGYLNEAKSLKQIADKKLADRQRFQPQVGPQPTAYQRNHESPSFTKATNTIADLVKLMKRGSVVKFAYVKKNGNYRIARGTLKPDLVKKMIKGTGVPRSKYGLVAYLDVDKHRWRSFRRRSIIRILGTMPLWKWKKKDKHFDDFFKKNDKEVEKNWPF